MGRYLHSLDHKGRIAIPKKFRDKLASACVLTKGLDGCLFLYPQTEWASLSSRVQSLPLTGSDARAFSRYLFSSATEVSFDKLGRIMIPEHLLNFALLEKGVLVIGVGSRIEIWSEKKWRLYNRKIEGKSEEIAEKLSDSGI